MKDENEPKEPQKLLEAHELLELEAGDESDEPTMTPVLPDETDTADSEMPSPSTHDVTPPAQDPANPVTATAVDLSQPTTVAMDHVAPPKHPPISKAAIVLVSFFAIGLLAVAGVVAWYFMVRTPDAEYEKAVTIVDSMVARADDIESARKLLTDGPAVAAKPTSSQETDTQAEQLDETIERLKKARSEASAYTNDIRDLQGLSVMSKDGNINAFYATDKQRIEEFGKSADTYFETAIVYVSAVGYCTAKNVPANIATLKDVEEYDDRVEKCEDYLKANKSVVDKNFNQVVYEPFRKNTLDLMKYSRAYLTAPKNSKAWDEAALGMAKSASGMLETGTAVVEELKMTKNPKQQLTALKAKLEERKQQFIR